MIRILLIGEDAAILKDRAAVLQQPGVEVTYCLAKQFDDEVGIAQPPFDGVILCHTIDRHVKAPMLTADIFRHWRQTPVLRMVKATGELAPQSGVDTDMVIGDPGEVVAIALKMLGRAPGEQSRSLAARPAAARAA